MKRKIILTLLLALSTAVISAQPGKCISGNCKTGRGRMLYADSSTYEGNWTNGKREGRGTFEDAGSIYTGMWKAGVPSDSGTFTQKHILHSENRLYAEDIRIGRVTSGILSGPGIFVSLALSGGKMDTLLMWKGNFVNDQLSGKGSFYISRMVTAYSDNWTDNYHFSDGKTVDYKTGDVATGSYANGILTPKAGAVAAQAPASSSAPATTASNNNNSKSMLDYGIFDTHRYAAPSTAAKTAHDYKVYCFVSTCTGSGKTFRVLSKVTADLTKHNMDEIKAEAVHRISNNGWYAQSSPDYVGTDDAVHVDGTPGRDYVVSEAQLYDF